MEWQKVTSEFCGSPHNETAEDKGYEGRNECHKEGIRDEASRETEIQEGYLPLSICSP